MIVTDRTLAAEIMMNSIKLGIPFQAFPFS